MKILIYYLLANAISITERTAYIGRVRNLASAIARLYVEQRKEMNYPMLREAK